MISSLFCFFFKTKKSIQIFNVLVDLYLRMDWWWFNQWIQSDLKFFLDLSSIFIYFFDINGINFLSSLIWTTPIYIHTVSSSLSVCVCLLTTHGLHIEQFEYTLLWSLIEYILYDFFLIIFANVICI